MNLVTFLLSFFVPVIVFTPTRLESFDRAIRQGSFVVRVEFWVTLSMHPSVRINVIFTATDSEVFASGIELAASAAVSVPVAGPPCLSEFRGD